MKFKVTTVANNYRVENIKDLVSIGFKFTKPKSDGIYVEKLDKDVYVEINTLDELIQFFKTQGDIIIEDDDDGSPSIKIYDDYL
jgi:hypothetical protein